MTSSYVCPSCKKNKVINHLDKLIPLFSYRLWNKELLFTWKIGEDRTLSFVFAKKINELLKELKFDAIVPVPPRPSKIKEKGWDQINELSDYLAYVFNFNVLKLLKRFNTRQQKKLDRKARLETIESGYGMKTGKELEKVLKGQALPETVILLDDVTTTGATLESCGKILKEEGVENIIGVTLFTVD